MTKVGITFLKNFKFHLESKLSSRVTVTMSDNTRKVSIKIRPSIQKKTRIFLSGTSTGEIKSTGKNNNDKKFSIEDSKKDNKRSHTFDSGFFSACTDTNPDENEIHDIPKIGIAKRGLSVNSASETKKVLEVQQTKFRCQPVHQPILTTTPTIHRSKSFVENTEDKNDDVFDNKTTRSMMNGNYFNQKRYGSMRVPPNISKEKFDFVNKASEIRAYLSMKKKNLEEGKSDFTMSNRVELKKQIKTQPQVQYPIERKVVPRRGNSSNLSSAASSACASPTDSEPDDEQEKFLLFTRALQRAVMRKQEIYD